MKGRGGSSRGDPSTRELTRLVLVITTDRNSPLHKRLDIRPWFSMFCNLTASNSAVGEWPV